MKYILLWRGGVKHYFAIERMMRRNDSLFIYDPKRKKFLGREYYHKNSNQVIFVDDEIYSCGTIYRAAKQLGIKSFLIAGDSKTVKVDIPLSSFFPTKPLIVVVGKSGIGKSLFCQYLSAIIPNSRVLRWGKIAKEFAGKYGERLSEIERDDPFFLAKKIVPHLQNDEVIILDGPKTIKQIEFLGFSTHRPIIPIHLENDEDVRRLNIEYRQADDDVYDVQRTRLFEDSLEEIREKSLVVDLRENDHRVLIDLLSRHFQLDLRGSFPRTLYSKTAMLQSVQRALRKYRSNPSLPQSGWTHTSYLRKFDVREERLVKAVSITATAFRLIDDILDEHPTREGVESMYVRKGVFNTIIVATLMLLHVKHLLHEDELKDFFKMIDEVFDGVFQELLFEREDRSPTFEEYLRSLKRETGFRVWVNKFTINPMPENLVRLKAGLSQVKDDLGGATKYGREDTDTKLNRPSVHVLEYI